LVVSHQKGKISELLEQLIFKVCSFWGFDCMPEAAFSLRVEALMPTQLAQLDPEINTYSAGLPQLHGVRVELQRLVEVIDGEV